ncbi:MAG TPA: ABC transporter ATP-binding protein [Candidatus Enterococcus avicola]|uniref:ABC transporter ATP-binding protein n=1 Tax=Candidatus Enterococcus avicola TaxID=2838561 RepID=A0A9D2F7K3_9ENTE|nr:ABC transporter ATP-binding protein [Candidatus Enterococcus avicola]
MKFIVENLAIQFRQTKILEHVSLELEAGEIVGLVAPNGTGKTTLLKGIAGLLKLNSGFIWLEEDGHRIEQREAFLSRMFFVLSSDAFYENLSVLEHLQVVQKYWKSKISIEEASSFFGITYFHDKKIKELSLGMKQQLLLTLYLISDASLLLLDEPLNGLDPTNVRRFNELIQHFQEAGKMVLMSSHNLYNIKETCTRVCFLNEKKIIADIDVNEDLDAFYDRQYVTKVGK